MSFRARQRADVCKAGVGDALGPSLDGVPGAGAPVRSLTCRQVQRHVLEDTRFTLGATQRAPSRNS